MRACEGVRGRVRACFTLTQKSSANLGSSEAILSRNSEFVIKTNQKPLKKYSNLKISQAVQPPTNQRFAYIAGELSGQSAASCSILVKARRDFM